MADNDLPLGGSGRPAVAPDGKAAKTVAAKAIASHPFMRVMETVEVGTSGGGSYLIRAGDEINVGDYADGEPLQPGQLPRRLRAAGAKLEPCEAPAWWVEAQEQAQARYEQSQRQAAEYNRRMEEARLRREQGGR